MNVDPKHIIQLHMIVELGSYSRAAEKLNITQPGLTRNIRVLEERLGVKLLRRGKTGARPTDEGKMIASYGKKLFEINQRVSGYFDGLRVGDFGKIRLGLAYTLSNAYLAKPIHEYLEEKTHSVIQVSSGSTLELVEQLQAEKIDVVLGGVQISKAGDDYVFEALTKNYLMVVGRKGHPLVSKVQVGNKDLEAFRWIISAEFDPIRKDVDSFLSALGIKKNMISLEVSSTSLIIETLLISDYLVALPSVIAQKLIDVGLVSEVKIAEVHNLRPIGVAYRRNSLNESFVQSFVTHIKRWFASHHGPMEDA
ncbi:MAG: LysR family transcriptional regulator [Comamonas sp.]